MEGWSEGDIEVDVESVFMAEEQWDGLDLKELQLFLKNIEKEHKMQGPAFINSLVLGNQLDSLSLQQQQKIYQQYVMYKTNTSINSFNNL